MNGIRDKVVNSWNSDIMKEEIISETKEHEMSDNLAELDNAYDTIDQAIKAVDRFCNDNGHPIRVYSKCTVGQHNRKTKGEELQIRDLPETHIHSLRWVCKHFGKEEPKRTEVQRKRSHYSKGCEFFIYIAWDRMMQCYRLKTHNLKHNHAYGPDVYPLYALRQREQSSLKRKRKEIIDADTAMKEEIKRQQKEREILHTKKYSEILKEFHNLDSKGVQYLFMVIDPDVSDVIATASPLGLDFINSSSVLNSFLQYYVDHRNEIEPVLNKNRENLDEKQDDVERGRRTSKSRKEKKRPKRSKHVEDDDVVIVISSLVEPAMADDDLTDVKDEDIESNRSMNNDVDDQTSNILGKEGPLNSGWDFQANLLKVHNLIVNPHEMEGTAPTRSEEGEGMYSCGECQKTFRKPGDMKRHFRQHFRDAAESFACPVCDKRFRQERYLWKVHMHLHNPQGRIETETFDCNQCEKRCRNADTLAKHMLYHEFSICDLCGERVRSSFIKYHRSKHDRNYKCSMCVKEYATKQTLERHLAAHQNKSGCVCQICDHRSSTTTLMKRHMLHHQERTCPCPICGKLFYCMPDVTKHMNAIHIKAKKPKKTCHICGKEVNILKLHMQEIHGEKSSHECKECGKKFSRKPYLRYHCVSKHNLVYSFRCSNCQQLFCSKEQLSEHYSSCPKQPWPRRNFPCPVCGKVLEKRFVLEKHMKRKHLNISGSVSMPMEAASSDNSNTSEDSTKFTLSEFHITGPIQDELDNVIVKPTCHESNVINVLVDRK